MSAPCAIAASNASSVFSAGPSGAAVPQAPRWAITRHGSVIRSAWQRPWRMRTCVRMGSSAPYVELHCHSAFSFLDGASLPDELVPTALELGYRTMALTDHNTVSGSMEFAVSARALGLRPIHGAEIDLADGRHLTLLVEDGVGWSNLCRILTRAHAHTRGDLDPPTRPRRPGPPSQAFVQLTDVLEHAEGLVCLSECTLRGVHDELTLRR